MKRTNPADENARKRLRLSLVEPLADAERDSARLPCRSTCPRTAAILQWRDGVHLKFPHTAPYESVKAEPAVPTLDEVVSETEQAVSETMSEKFRLREQKKRSRSCSPTKKSPQYRNTVLKPARIYVDFIHDLPAEIEALLPDELRNLLDRSLPSSAPAGRTAASASEVLNDTTEKDLSEEISKIAAVYREECRRLARKPGSEPEYRTHLYFCVVERLARVLPRCHTLSVNCSDKLWCSSLKPPTATLRLSLPWPPLPPNITLPQVVQCPSLESTQNSNGGQNDYTLPLLASEPSESSTTSELEDSITTPKPDITVGIARDVFSTSQAGLLEYWQANMAVLSDPHVTQGDMRFPFFFVEAKGLATNGNLIGVQNQAAGVGTCAIRLLGSLAAQTVGLEIPRIIFSLTTEGALHELWVHYQWADENISKYHMTCLGTWRTTIDRHANEFVRALAIILRWGVNDFYPQINQALDHVLGSARITF